jgi:hypothetical protein
LVASGYGKIAEARAAQGAVEDDAGGDVYIGNRLPVTMQASPHTAWWLAGGYLGPSATAFTSCHAIPHAFGAAVHHAAADEGVTPDRRHHRRRE